MGKISLVLEDDIVFDRTDPSLDLLENRQEVGMDQQHVVFGMVDRVEDLFGGQLDVDGVQYRSDHRHGEEAFQVAVAVPVHDRNRIALLDAEGL